MLATLTIIVALAPEQRSPKVTSLLVEALSWTTTLILKIDIYYNLSGIKKLLILD